MQEETPVEAQVETVDRGNDARDGIQKQPNQDGTGRAGGIARCR